MLARSGRRTGSGTQRLLVLALGFAAASACGRGDAGAGLRAAQSHGSANVGGQVISTVHGYAITVAEVRDLVAGSDLSAPEALRRLQAERLLMVEAERRGFSHGAAVDQVARQALVQSLLQRVTDQATASDEELHAAYERAKSRFERPERRVAVHVLAKLPKKATPEAQAAAREFAARMIEPLTQATDIKTFLGSTGQIRSPHFKVVAEKLPAFHLGTALVEPFLKAAFELTEPGVVPHPVQTSYGWHAIRVLEIRPAESTPYAEAIEQLRPEVILAHKKQLVDELLAGARKQHPVELPAGLRETLAKLEL
jgi:parvulin-like peptidyl-prolyl isomerase